MDIVFIEELRVDTVIGVYDWERNIRQTVVLDLEMAFDNRVPAARDAIEDTLDYKKVSKRLVAFIAETHFGLVETLAIKCRRALAATGAKTLIVAGGVGANVRLRALLDDAARREGFRVAFPRPEFCTDNGAMIAFAGALRLEAGLHDAPAIFARPRWDLETLPALA